MISLICALIVESQFYILYFLVINVLLTRVSILLRVNCFDSYESDNFNTSLWYKKWRHFVIFFNTYNSQLSTFETTNISLNYVICCQDNDREYNSIYFRSSKLFMRSIKQRGKNEYTGMYVCYCTAAILQFSKCDIMCVHVLTHSLLDMWHKHSSCLLLFNWSLQIEL